MCSVYIDRLYSYRRLINKKLKKKEIADLQKMTTPADDLLSDDLQELFANFDKAFLQIFPNFVDSLNGLLLPSKQFVLEEGELLNTELRILALIRLGIQKARRLQNCCTILQLQSITIALE